VSTSHDDVYDLVRRAAPFADLPRASFEAVLDMLSGRFPSHEFSDLRPRVTRDRSSGSLRARVGAKRIAVTNPGTIPDRGLYGVFLVGDDGATSRRVGELDEEMVFETRVEDVFLLGASSWRVEEITHDRVLVSPAPGVPGAMPFWHGDRPARPLAFGKAIGKLARELVAAERNDAEQRLRDSHDLERKAAANLPNYLDDLVEKCEVPTDRTIVVERFVDQVGDWRICILSPFGAAVLRALDDRGDRARASSDRIARRVGLLGRWHRLSVACDRGTACPPSVDFGT
jgi:ATP-dependent Lhr-like helicase